MRGETANVSKAGLLDAMVINTGGALERGDKIEKKNTEDALRRCLLRDKKKRAREREELQ